MEPVRYDYNARRPEEKTHFCLCVNTDFCEKVKAFGVLSVENTIIIERFYTGEEMYRKGSGKTVKGCSKLKSGSEIRTKVGMGRRVVTTLLCFVRR